MLISTQGQASLGAWTGLQNLMQQFLFLMELIPEI